MYKIGDTVIYRNDGVCTIAEITVRMFKEKETEYYVLNPVHNENAEIFVPKGNPDLVSKMRKVLTRSYLKVRLKSVAVKTTATFLFNVCPEWAVTRW